MSKFEVLYWVDVLLWDAGPSWQIDSMSGSNNGSTHYSIPLNAPQLLYTLPVNKESDKTIKLYKPLYGSFCLLNKPINGWSEVDWDYAWVPRNKVVVNDNPNLCEECGWQCYQQCFRFVKSFRRI